ncbi:hypothetical protein Tco_0832160 [Tanacetum coccineum]
MLRGTCGKTMLDMIPRVECIERSSETIIDKMREGRLRWYGHVRRRHSQSARVRRVLGELKLWLYTDRGEGVDQNLGGRIDMNQPLLTEDMTLDRNEWSARIRLEGRICLFPFVLWLCAFALSCFVHCVSFAPTCLFLAGYVLFALAIFVWLYLFLLFVFVSAAPVFPSLFPCLVSSLVLVCSLFVLLPPCCGMRVLPGFRRSLIPLSFVCFWTLSMLLRGSPFDLTFCRAFP